MDRSPFAASRRQVLAALGALGTLPLATALPAWAQTEPLLEKIKKRKKIIVASEAALPPFEFIKDGKIVGYGKDLLDYIVADLGVELEQLDLPFQGILPGLLVGKFDFVCASIGYSQERAAKYALTMPITVSTPAAMKRKGDNRIKSIDDLAGKVVGTQRASVGEQTTRALDEQLKAKGLGGFKELKLFTAYTEIYLSVANGSVDAVIQNDTSFAVLMKERPGLYEIVGKVADERYSGWAVRAEDKDFRDYLNTKILELKHSGKLAELQEKWYGIKMNIPEKDYLPAGAV